MMTIIINLQSNQQLFFVRKLSFDFIKKIEPPLHLIRGTSVRSPLKGHTFDFRKFDKRFFCPKLSFVSFSGRELFRAPKCLQDQANTFPFLWHDQMGVGLVCDIKTLKKEARTKNDLLLWLAFVEIMVIWNGCWLNKGHASTAGCSICCVRAGPPNCCNKFQHLTNFKSNQSPRNLEKTHTNTYYNNVFRLILIQFCCFSPSSPLWLLWYSLSNK